MLRQFYLDKVFWEVCIRNSLKVIVGLEAIVIMFCFHVWNLFTDLDIFNDLCLWICFNIIFHLVYQFRQISGVDSNDDLAVAILMFPSNHSGKLNGEFKEEKTC